MNGRFVLDSNVVIGLFDRDVNILDQVARSAETIIPTTVIGELYFGAFRSRRGKPNVERIDALARSHEVVEIDMETARLYGLIKSQLRLKGTPIPSNDIWIAAVAQRFSASLATRDAHFDFVENLSVVRW